MTNKGNIVLYQSYGPSFLALGETLLVQRLTDGPYVHAAIIIDDQGTLIEARTDGVHLGRLNNAVNGAPYAVDTRRAICAIRTANKDENKRAQVLDENKINDALTWLARQAQSADPYGWMDIVAQGLDAVFPGHLMISQPGRYDCSNLATMFLFLCGVELPFAAPFDVNPNDLGQFFGLLPTRKKVLA